MEMRVTSTSAFSQRVEPYRHDEFEQAVARVETLARLMDSAVAIPGTNVRIGLDAAIGLVPVIGDLVSQAIASYIIWEARQLGVTIFAAPLGYVRRNRSTGTPHLARQTV